MVQPLADFPLPSINSSNVLIVQNVNYKYKFCSINKNKILNISTPIFRCYFKDLVTNLVNNCDEK